eukprot:GHVT01032380.1.p1 GENE.GHVT01032380.1~~GHVT01032380.1.p1  ORF type:complete len:580 (-),score=100.05 GHVT01032380.1:162-1901(-)
MPRVSMDHRPVEAEEKGQEAKQGTVNEGTVGSLTAHSSWLRKEQYPLPGGIFSEGYSGVENIAKNICLFLVEVVTSSRHRRQGRSKPKLEREYKPIQHEGQEEFPSYDDDPPSSNRDRVFSNFQRGRPAADSNGSGHGRQVGAGLEKEVANPNSEEETWTSGEGTDSHATECCQASGSDDAVFQNVNSSPSSFSPDNLPMAPLDSSYPELYFTDESLLLSTRKAMQSALDRLRVSRALRDVMIAFERCLAAALEVDFNGSSSTGLHRFGATSQKLQCWLLVALSAADVDAAICFQSAALEQARGNDDGGGLLTAASPILRFSGEKAADIQVDILPRAGQTTWNGTRLNALGTRAEQGEPVSTLLEIRQLLRQNGDTDDDALRNMRRAWQRYKRHLKSKRRPQAKRETAEFNCMQTLEREAEATKLGERIQPKGRADQEKPPIGGGGGTRKAEGEYKAGAGREVQVHKSEREDVKAFEEKRDQATGNSCQSLDEEIGAGPHGKKNQRRNVLSRLLCFFRIVNSLARPPNSIGLNSIQEAIRHNLPLPAVRHIPSTPILEIQAAARRKPLTQRPVKPWEKK